MELLKYFVFSDVHGEYTKLITSLREEGFDVYNHNHILVSLGDSFDRGSENKKLFDFYKVMLEKGRLFHIRGNHEQLLLDYLDGMSDGTFDAVNNGMKTTIMEFAEVNGIQINKVTGIGHYRYLIKERNPELIKFLNDTKDIFRIDNFILTHAGFTDKNYMGVYIVDNWTRTDKFFERFRKIQKTHNVFVVGHWHARGLRKQFSYKKEEQGTTKGKYFLKNFMGIDGAVNLPQIDRVPILIIETDHQIEALDKSVTLNKLEPQLF